MIGQKKRCASDSPFYRVTYAQKRIEVHGKVFYLGKRGYHFDLFRGRLSGYSFCCIEAFIKRGFERRLKNSDDPEAKKHLELWRKTETARKNDVFLKRFLHILCETCAARYRSEDFMPQYYHCESCDWTQFLKRECNLCGEMGKALSVQDTRPLFMGR